MGTQPPFRNGPGFHEALPFASVLPSDHLGPQLPHFGISGLFVPPERKFATGAPIPVGIPLGLPPGLFTAGPPISKATTSGKKPKKPRPEERYMMKFESTQCGEFQLFEPSKKGQHHVSSSSSHQHRFLGGFPSKNPTNIITPAQAAAAAAFMGFKPPPPPPPPFGRGFPPKDPFLVMASKALPFPPQPPPPPSAQQQFSTNPNPHLRPQPPSSIQFPFSTGRSQPPFTIIPAQPPPPPPQISSTQPTLVNPPQPSSSSFSSSSNQNQPQPISAHHQISPPPPTACCTFETEFLNMPSPLLGPLFEPRKVVMENGETRNGEIHGSVDSEFHLDDFDFSFDHQSSGGNSKQEAEEILSDNDNTASKDEFEWESMIMVMSPSSMSPEDQAPSVTTTSPLDHQNDKEEQEEISNRRRAPLEIPSSSTAFSRQLTPFRLFAHHMSTEIKQKKEISKYQMRREINGKWEGMNCEERQVFVDTAEKLAAELPKHKRLLTSYNLYFQTRLRELKREDRELSARQASDVANENWKCESPEIRQIFAEEAARMRKHLLEQAILKALQSPSHSSPPLSLLSSSLPSHHLSTSFAKTTTSNIEEQPDQPDFDISCLFVGDPEEENPQSSPMMSPSPSSLMVDVDFSSALPFSEHFFTSSTLKDGDARLGLQEGSISFDRDLDSLLSPLEFFERRDGEEDFDTCATFSDPNGVCGGAMLSHKRKRDSCSATSSPMLTHLAVEPFQKKQSSQLSKTDATAVLKDTVNDEDDPSFRFPFSLEDDFIPNIGSIFGRDHETFQLTKDPEFLERQQSPTTTTKKHQQSSSKKSRREEVDLSLDLWLPFPEVRYF